MKALLILFAINVIACGSTGSGSGTSGDDGETSAATQTSPNPDESGDSVNSSGDVAAVISSYYSIAQSITIDGQDDDWAGVWEATSDHTGTTTSDLDIVATSILPLEDRLYIKIRTKTSPRNNNHWYFFNIDIVGRGTWDFQVSAAPSGSAILWVIENEGETSVRYDNTNAVTTAIGEVVEIEVLYSALAPVLPTRVADGLSMTRGFVTVSPLTFENSEVADRGPKMGAFVLKSGTYDPLPPLQNAIHPSLAMATPFAERVYVSQGPFGSFSHSGRWAYDLVIHNERGQSSNPRQSQNNQDYYIFGAGILAPFTGTVANISSGIVDHGPTSDPSVYTEANRVLLETEGQDHELILTHMKEGSPFVAAGQGVSLGTALGEVGNTGYSTSPHLHLELLNSDDSVSVPVALANVVAGLNNADDDPFSQVYERFVVRESFYIRPAP